MIPVQHLAESIASKIEQHFGVTVPPEDVQLRFNEWRWLGTVNDLAVVFVAEDEAAMARLKSERAVLDHLNQRVSFAVPSPVYCSDDLPQVDIRRLAAGKTGMQFHANLVAQRSLGLAAGERMGRMLAELHSSMDSHEASAAGVTQLGNEPWLPDQIRRALTLRLDGALHSTFDRVLDWHSENRCRPAAESVLIHHDFGSHNFTFDPGTGLPRGLYDFEGICWNDPHWDFHLLPSYGDDIMAMTIKAYTRLTRRTISVNRVRLLHAVYALSNVAWRTAVYNSESMEVIDGMKWVEQALKACGGITMGS